MPTRAVLAVALLLVACALLLVACGGGPEPEAPPTEASPAAPSPAATDTPSATAPSPSRAPVAPRGLPPYDCVVEPSFPSLVPLGRASAGGPILANECGTAFRPTGDGGWEQLPEPRVDSPTGRAYVHLDLAARRATLVTKEGGHVLPEIPVLWAFARDTLVCAGLKKVTCFDSATAESTEYALPDGDELIAVLPIAEGPAWVIAGVRPTGPENPVPLSPTDSTIGYRRPREPRVLQLGSDEAAASVPRGQLIDHHPIRDRWLVLDKEDFVVLDGEREVLRIPARRTGAHFLQPRFSHDGSRFCGIISGVSPQLDSPCVPVDG